jgi:hypothetical protein
MVLKWCWNGVVMVFKWCWNCVTMKLPWYHHQASKAARSCDAPAHECAEGHIYNFFVLLIDWLISVCVHYVAHSSCIALSENYTFSTRHQTKLCHKSDFPKITIKKNMKCEIGVHQIFVSPGVGPRRTPEAASEWLASTGAGWTQGRLCPVCCILSVVCCLLSAVCCLMSDVCCLMSDVCFDANYRR